MIGYVTLGTNDLDKASAFYDALFKTIDIGRFMEEAGYFIAWGAGPDAPSVAATVPFDGQPASVGNGVMVALAMQSREQVDCVYRKALELGATSEGEPGVRGEPKPPFYAGYFRDLDGNKLNAFFVG